MFPRVHNFRNITGRRFGRLVVAMYLGHVRGKPSWGCQCDCGHRCIVQSKLILRGITRSCGCLGEVNTRHGCRGTRIYRIWTGMLTRCRNRKASDYRSYGGRGIQVCERWLTFAHFLADMGMPPTDNHSIERENNNGNYEPGNCVWLPVVEQAWNRRSSLFLEANGERLTASQWDRRMGYSRGTVAKRFRHGFSVSDAIFKPINKSFSRPQKTQKGVSSHGDGERGESISPKRAG